MIKVKLIVFYISFSIVLCCAKYCEICPRHILCKYKMPGPSASCKRYDNTAVLTENDINEIVNRINDRRNFIALGLSKLLPQAANMKKISWSEELATFAQRWVDQCDQSLRPDKEDQCRDLVEESVGQNIASILDPSPNFNVKSFVDIWSMPTLDYFGSVSYYNQSRNHKTYYFTQLIWANSDMVGCGRARFFHHKQNTIIERLVCNFAPKGNIHGQPIYNIGYPATQCPIYTRPDRNYKSLCKRYLQENVTKLTPSSPHPKVNSLLRIINLSNNSVKQEMDPIRNDWKYLKSNVNKSIEQRHQKTRHVLNNTYESMKHVSYNNRRNNINHSRSSYINTYSQAREHSRVYHGYDMHNNVYTLSHQEHFNKFSYLTEIFNPYLNQNYRKHNENPCTRKNMYPENYSSTCEAVSDKYTRPYEKNNYLQSTKSYGPSTNIYYAIKSIFPHELCPCTSSTTTYQIVTPTCLCNNNCNILNTNCPSTTVYPNFRRNKPLIEEYTNKTGEFHYYDLLPKMGVRRGDIISDYISSKTLHYLNTNNDKIFEMKPNSQQQIKNTCHQNSNNDRDFSSYNPFHLYERHKRDDEKFKPFWQVGEFSQKMFPQLKSIKYTTLINRNKKLVKKTTITIKNPTTTEPITIKIKDNINIRINNKNSLTEKYLSFDELMHLRKLGITDVENNARRKANDALRNTNISTTEVTANTPFIRKKHCTRKLTCTWTASSPTGADGSVIPGGNNIDRGSRTPPGYVDGCTRTSTCTRDFMDRNKMATVGEESSGEPDPENEDYCERKSLNIHKRKSGFKRYAPISSKHTESSNKETRSSFHLQQLTTASQSNCICYEKISRIKRDESTNQFNSLARNNAITRKCTSESLSYGNLFYLVLHKIISIWKNNRYSINQCLCNFTDTLRNNVLLLFLLFICNLYHLFI